VANRNDDNILLLAGTLDGLYLYESTCERNGWVERGPVLKGFEVSHAILDPRDGKTIWAAVTGEGQTAVYRSPDRGETWDMAGEPFDCEAVWHVEPGHASHPGRVYAGVKPAALYQSDDNGDTWQPVSALNDHDSRGEWYGGGGGLILHTIVTNHDDPNDIAVGISVAGVFRSTDGGASWSPSNEGTLSSAEMYEEWNGVAAQHAGVHRCVHKMVRNPANTSVLFQQNHDGVYRSDDGGQNWIDVSDGLRDRFGFVIGATRDGSVYVVPQDMDQIRYSGQLEVYRMRDADRTWQALTVGLPEVERLTLYREGMATDNCLPGGVYFGTCEGDLYGTADGGEAWRKMASGLPPVRSVSCEHFPA
jgi:photosystem II stability/assembly factor-like uncharacterized protein